MKPVDKKLDSLDLNIFRKENPEFKIHIITSHPKSDMGKGHITMNLSRVLPNSHIIKYDGIINSSIGDKYIFDSEESDDFNIYRKNTRLKFSTFNALMLGDILYSFITEYGKNKGNFSLRPHIAEFVILKTYESWVKIGRPSNLIIEIGGTMNDREVEPIWPYIIWKFRQEIGYDVLKVYLLSEVSFESGKIKTKILQNSISNIIACGVQVDHMLVRLPQGITLKRSEEQEAKERIIRKLRENCNFYIERRSLILIRHWEKHVLENYLQIIKTSVNKY